MATTAPPSSFKATDTKQDAAQDKPTSLYQSRQSAATSKPGTSPFGRVNQSGASPFSRPAQPGSSPFTRTDQSGASPFARPGQSSAIGSPRAQEQRPFTSLRSQAQAGTKPAPPVSRFSRTDEKAKPASPFAARTSQTPGTTATTSRPASPFRKDLHITDEEFLLIRDFIYQQCGIFIAENRKYLVENRLSNRIKELNLKSYNEYYNFLRFDANRKQELTKLFEVVTTNETSFFRNPPQLDVFQRVVLAEAIDQARKAGTKKLRLWSAGCSTGEEPYTLAIILHETLRGEIDSWDIKITANDLSEAVLAAARRGIYNEYALRTTPKEMVSKYFQKEGNIYKVDPAMKRLVSFGQINLSDKEQLKRVEKSQIVFCRNVIIYFDDEMKRKVINAFYDNLQPKGVLIIGHSESLHNISRAFQLEHHKGTILYRKSG